MNGKKAALKEYFPGTDVCSTKDKEVFFVNNDLYLVVTDEEREKYVNVIDNLWTIPVHDILEYAGYPVSIFSEIVKHYVKRKLSLANDLLKWFVMHPIKKRKKDVTTYMLDKFGHAYFISADRREICTVEDFGRLLHIYKHKNQCH